MFCLLLQTSLLSLIITLFYSFINHHFGHLKSSKLPPGSSGWLPVLGDTLPFVLTHPSFTRGQFLESSIKRYGTIFRSHLFGHRTIVSCDPEFNTFILNNEERLVVASYPGNVQGVLGDVSLLIATGDLHKKLRGAAVNFFTNMRNQSSHLADVEESAILVLDSWKIKDTIPFWEEARKYTFNIIVKKTLSLGPDDPETNELMENFVKFMHGLVSAPINIPGTPYAKAIQANKHIKGMIRRMEQRRQQRKSEDVEGRIDDLLDLLLANKELISQEDTVTNLVLDTLFGGYETTSSLIATIVKLLSDNPNILSHLKEEHLDVMRGKCNETLGWEDYKKMEFTQCVINEGLRLGNIVKFVHRKTIKPIQYKGYEIPVGWKILPIFTGVHLDPSLHPDPMRFDPSRWQQEENISSICTNFMPFGGGKRLCPGSELGRLETAVFLHHLVLRYSWTPVMDSDLPMSSPNLEFKNGLHLKIKPLPKPT